jgi:hypothetical protein
MAAADVSFEDLEAAIARIAALYQTVAKHEQLIAQLISRVISLEARLNQPAHGDA